ncbi:MAG: hypothetical protein IT236_07390 [Bacteroidia bacterium]|nr:hypothetical protein [Bacteroidia bacterium]
MNKYNKKFELTYASITYRSTGIVHIHYRDHLFTVHENREIFQLLKKEMRGHQCPIMISGDGFSNHDNESKQFFAGQELAGLCSAIAFVAQGMPQELVIKFLLRFYKPKVDSRYFLNEKQADEWLKNYINKISDNAQLSA